MTPPLTPLQSLHKLLERWDLAALGILSSGQSEKAKQYAKAILCCHKELFEALDGVEDGALLPKQPQPHEVKVQ